MTTRPDSAPSRLDPLAAHIRNRADHVTRLRSLVASLPVGRLAGVGISLGTGPTDRRKLRRNAYVAAEYDELSWQDQLIVMACAVQDAAACDPLFSHLTAAAIWQLPTIGSRCQLVEYALPPDARGRTPNVRRRRSALTATGTDIGGLRVTTYERTIVDHARQAKLASGVAVCDDALHRGLTTRDALFAEWRRVPTGARGRRMAELAIHLADERAESPLESLSRVRMFQASLPMPELQWKFFHGDEFIGRTDFYWEHLGLVGECDGKLKYVVEQEDPGRTAVDALLGEKRRELLLRRHRGVRDVARWDWDEALPAGMLPGILAAHGVRSVLDGGWPVPDGPLPRRAFVI